MKILGVNKNGFPNYHFITLQEKKLLIIGESTTSRAIHAVRANMFCAPTPVACQRKILFLVDIALLIF